MRFLFIFAFFIFSPPSLAMLIDKQVVLNQLNSALMNVDIQVLKVEASSDPNYTVSSQITAQVTNILSVHDDGQWLPAVGDQITITSIGGELNGVGTYLTGYPIPHLNQEYQAYLTRAGDHVFKLVGFESGLIAKNAHHGWTRNRTDGSNGSGTGPYLLWNPSYFPVPFYISAVTMSGHPDYSAAIVQSFKTWRDVNPTTLEFVGMGCSTKILPGNDGVNSVILINANWHFDPAIVAITQNFYVSDGPKAGMILDSDTLLNGVNYQFSTTNEQGNEDVQDIVTHEAGHFHGMGHDVIPPIDDTATMFTYAVPNETIKRVLKSDDLAGLFAGYYGESKTKGTYTYIPCNIDPPPNTTSCAAAHDHGGSPWGVFYAVTYLLCLVYGSRFLYRKG